jgi:hypothetical protein
MMTSTFGQALVRRELPGQADDDRDEHRVLGDEERSRLGLHGVARLVRALAQLGGHEGGRHDDPGQERGRSHRLALEHVGNEPRAQQLERRRKGPDRLALQERQAEALEHQHAGQGDDERRHAEERDEPALRGADRRAREQARERRGNEVPAELDHQHRRQRADEADHRADRQVDVPGDDHEQHAQRHDDDVAVLQHQVRQVERLQQRAVGQELEQPHDDDERHQHAVLAHVALQEAGVRPARCMRWCAGRLRGRNDFVHQPAPR